MDNQYIESFEASDKQRSVVSRVRAATKQGMVEMLNSGLPEGYRIFYPQHMMTVTMPVPGSTFLVPVEVARYIKSVFTNKVQVVHAGSLPANYTPPPGYKLVKEVDEETSEE